MQLPALPATSSTVAMFLAAQAQDGFAPATLDRRLAAIRLSCELVERLTDLATLLRRIECHRNRGRNGPGPQTEYPTQAGIGFPLGEIAPLGNPAQGSQ